jgi:imidazolonepropionase-like amidohydrolase
MKARDLIHFLVEKKVVLTSTPSAADRPISQEELELLNPISREQYLSRSKSFPTFLVAAEPYVRKLERYFVAAGGTLVVGSDPENFGKIAGYADERALELLVEAGWNPLDVIRMATLGGAEFLGVADDRGLIAIGKAADLIVTNGNPATDIKSIEKVELVFKDGVAYDPHLLRESVKGLVGWH